MRSGIIEREITELAAKLRELEEVKPHFDSSVQETRNFHTEHNLLKSMQDTLKLIKEVQGSNEASQSNSSPIRWKFSTLVHRLDYAVQSDDRSYFANAEPFRTLTAQEPISTYTNLLLFMLGHVLQVLNLMKLEAAHMQPKLAKEAVEHCEACKEILVCAHSDFLAHIY